MKYLSQRLFRLTHAALAETHATFSQYRAVVTHRNPQQQHHCIICWKCLLASRTKVLKLLVLFRSANMASRPSSAGSLLVAAHATQCHCFSPPHMTTMQNLREYELILTHVCVIVLHMHANITLPLVIAGVHMGED